MYSAKPRLPIRLVETASDNAMFHGLEPLVPV